MSYTKIELTRDEKAIRKRKLTAYYNTPKLKQQSMIYFKEGTSTFTYTSQGTYQEWQDKGWHI